MDVEGYGYAVDHYQLPCLGVDYNYVALVQTSLSTEVVLDSTCKLLISLTSQPLLPEKREKDLNSILG